jgi:hypothetical protein
MMRKIILIASVLLGALTLAGCAKDKPVEGSRITSISLTADVAGSIETRTDITDPMNPVWTDGDAIGLYFAAGDEMVERNIRLEGTFTEDHATATFEGEAVLEEGDYTLYGYYPHGAVGDATEHYSTALIAVPAVQYPSATSFDAAADIMTMKPVAHQHTGEAISYDGLQFKRSLAILKIVLTGEGLAGEALRSVSITTNDPAVNFAGMGHFDLSDGSFKGFYRDASTTVTAEPVEDVYANGTDAVLICVPAMTIAAGTELTITGRTDSYVFERSVEVHEDMNLSAGNFFRIAMTIPEVEEYDPLAYDETLENEWLFDGQKVGIEYAAFEVYREPARDGYAFYFFDAAPDGPYYNRAILFYLPAAKIGQEIDLQVESDEADYWEFNFDAEGYYYGSGRPETYEKNIAAGKMIVQKEGTDIVYKLAVEFTNGQILKAKYVGEAIDRDYIEVGEDIMPGENQWAYNGVLTNIGDVEYDAMLETQGVGVLCLYDETGRNSVDLYLPLEMFDGRNINLFEIEYPWMIDYYGDFDFMLPTQSSSNESFGKMTSGTISVTLEGEGRITIVSDLVYNDAVHLRVNYSGLGYGVPEPPEPPKPTVPITSIDQLVGDWVVEQKLMQYGGGTFFATSHTHELTINKVSDTSLDIINFSGARTIYNEPLDDDIRVAINANLEMVIPTNVELIPSWQGEGTSHFIPYFGDGNYGGGWGVPFAPQTFGETEDGEIVMRMNPNYLSFVQTGNSNTDGTYFYTYSVIWTKPAGNAPVNVNAATPAVKDKFDMLSNPVPATMKQVFGKSLKPATTDTPTKGGVYSFRPAK